MRMCFINYNLYLHLLYKNGEHDVLLLESQPSKIENAKCISYFLPLLSLFEDGQKLEMHFCYDLATQRYSSHQMEDR